MSRVSYNFLGPSGLKVSNICLGTMLFGTSKAGRPSCSESEAHALLDKYVELGGNFIDTADVYTAGESETIIGKWLANQRRERLVIASKFGRSFDPTNPNATGASRKHIMWSIDASLKRLQTDYIDLYYMHLPDDGTPIEETLTAMNDLVRAGKVRYLAMSNAKGWQMQKIIEMSRYRGMEKFICIQQQYSLLCRSAEFELVDICKNDGIGLLPWSPLKGGWLSGKLKPGCPPGEDSRVGWVSAGQGRQQHSHPGWSWFAEDEQAWKVIRLAEEIAMKYGRTVPQVAIRWLLQKPFVPSVVVGPRTLDHLIDNMEASAGWELSPEEMKSLDEASYVKPPYPYDEYLTAPNANRQRP